MKIFDVWEEIYRWIYTKVQIELTLNLEIVLYEILRKKNEKKKHIRNLIILLTKLYIYIYTEQKCKAEKQILYH